jgi:glycosyltransferase involved in cell wall biosynthesis
MRIAVLGGYSPDKPMGGVQVHIDMLTSQLALMDEVELHIFTFGDKSQKIIRGNMTVHLLKKRLPWNFYLPFEILILVFGILRINPDLVHAHESCIPYSTATAIVGKKYPTLLTMHMFIKEWEKPKTKIGKFVRYITLQNEKFVLTHIPYIIAVSSYLKRQISEATHSKIYTIPNGIKFENSQKIKKYDFERPVLFCIGMLEYRKGFDLLVKSIPKIKEKFPNILLIIAGSGSEENNLKILTRELDLSDNVKFLGFVSEEEKNSYFSSSDIFIIPSRYEPFGIVLLEAMSWEKPIVASNVGGISEIVVNGRNGLIFESENIDELAQKVVTLLIDKDLRVQFGILGKAMAKDFSWENIASLTYGIYNNILNKK